MARFEESFWGTEFCSTQGFETLLARMKEGSNMCKELEDFLKHRAKAEEDYAKTLQKIVKSAGDGGEIGILRNAWDTVRKETEHLANVHMTMSQSLTKEAEDIRGFRKLQEQSRKETEEDNMKYTRLKRDLYKKTMDSKKSYEQKCREADAAENAYSTSRLKKKASGARQQAEQADTAYKSCVEGLEQSRVSWEKCHAHSCQVFQKMEEERIMFLRDKLWVHSNLGSMTCVQNDEHYEDMRKALEHCDEYKDINLFVNTKKTGTQRPAPVVYESYYPDGTKSAKRFAASPLHRDRPSTMSSRPPEPLPPTGSPAFSAPNLPTKDKQRTVSHAGRYGGDGGAYATVQDTRRFSSPNASPNFGEGDTVKVAFDYDSQGQQELTLRRGRHIRVLKRENDLWWQGEMDGKIGVFPSTYVEPISLI
ncbi:proline-serine-threonine phosphatase-interacting protein 2-like isoform X2 [Branchiostoma lanceolatum]|uniref:proline-serine-threonine phosphatase-interacting protein 2-like isoform X2 n=1 Tax=Branchiostoma lanceolatum TaxID=7740 RepID=UPI003451DD79